MFSTLYTPRVKIKCTMHILWKHVFQRRESVKSDWIENWCHWDLADFSSFLDLAKFWLLCAHKKVNDFESWSFFGFAKILSVVRTQAKVNNFGGIGDRTNLSGQFWPDKFIASILMRENECDMSLACRLFLALHGQGPARHADKSKIFTKAPGTEETAHRRAKFGQRHRGPKQKYRRAVVRSSTRTRTTRAPPRNPEGRESRKFEGAVL